MIGNQFLVRLDYIGDVQIPDHTDVALLEQQHPDGAIHEQEAVLDEQA